MRDDFDYRDAVESILRGQEIKFSRDDYDKHAIFAIPMSAKNVPVLRIFFSVSKFGDCKIRSYFTRDLPKDKLPAMIKTLNRINSEYRYITMSIDSDGDVLAAYDFTLFGTDPETLDQHVMTIFMLSCKIMDKSIKRVMKIVWLDDEDKDEDD